MVFSFPFLFAKKSTKSLMDRKKYVLLRLNNFKNELSKLKFREEALNRNLAPYRAIYDVAVNMAKENSDFLGAGGKRKGCNGAHYSKKLLEYYRKMQELYRSIDKVAESISLLHYKIEKYTRKFQKIDRLLKNKMNSKIKSEAKDAINSNEILQKPNKVQKF